MKAAKCCSSRWSGELEMTRSIARSAASPPRLCVTIASPAKLSGDEPILSAIIGTQIEARGA